MDEITNSIQEGNSRMFSRLLDYINDAERMGKKMQHKLPHAGGFCAWDSEINTLVGVTLGGKMEDDVWMTIDRLGEAPMPPLPPILTGWIKPHDLDLDNEPSLPPATDERVVTSSASRDELPEEEDAELMSTFDAYHAAWNSWAREERTKLITMNLYARFFALHQRFESDASASAVDIVWGSGIATYAPVGGAVVRYPLITKLIEISLDTKTLRLQIRPREADAHLELDAFAAAGNLGVSAVEESARALLESDDFEFSPFSTSSIEQILRSAVTHLDGQGVYLPDQEEWNNNGRPLVDPSDTLQINDGWVIFTRPKGSNFFFEDLDRLKESLKAEELTGGPAALVTPPKNSIVPKTPILYRGVSSLTKKFHATENIEAENNAVQTVRELYFPKPYNDEQVSIIEKLDHSDGVVVQGPPGTGKTHTIANVISHYLALGKRILVTSKGEPALAVLRDQLPEGIRDLAVSLLTNERDGMKQFEAAISKISAEVTRLNADELCQTVADLENRLNTLHADIAETDAQARGAAMAHMTRIEFNGKEWSSLDLAQFVLDHASQFDWMEPISWENSNDQSIDESILKKAHAARLLLGQNLSNEHPQVNIEGLPDRQEIGEIHAGLLALRATEEHLKIYSTFSVPLPSSSPEKIRQLQAALQSSKERLEHIPGGWNNGPWTENIMPIALDDPHCKDLEVLTYALSMVESLLRDGRLYVKKPVVAAHVPVELMPKYEQAIVALSQGKNPFPWYAFGMRKVKPYVLGITVASNPARSMEDWTHIINWRHHRERQNRDIAQWNDVAETWGIEPAHAEGDLKDLRDVFNRCTAVLSIAKKFSALDGDDYMCLFDCAPKEITNPLIWGKWQRVLKLAADRMEALSHEEKRERLLRWTEGQTKSVAEIVDQFTTETLGHAGVPERDVMDAWDKCLAAVAEIKGLYDATQNVEEAATMLSNAGAPLWSERLALHPLVDEQDPWTRPDWQDAWQWSRARDWLNRIDAQGVMKDLQIKRRKLEDQLRQSYVTLVETKTWLHLMENVTPAMRSALNAYMNAVRMLGKGTGVRAHRYRQEARDAMAKAYQAVPCWIMPHWRVSESLPSEIGSFDLVIIDEASQSDLWAMPSILRGKKIMVVGDDQQVSPDGIGLDEEKIQELSRRYLSDQAFGAELTPEKSIYDLARVAFADSQVMLREHFRCVRPIIEFSNREFYNGEIRALRLPPRSKRMDPALVDVRITNGFRKAGSKTNLPEAQAIVNKIREICVNRSMDGKTIGVVSLLGNEQSQLIESMIRSRIDPRDIIDHQIACGDARSFQGKERDIIMLSMVVDPARVVAATKREFRQRYNVATSRARDQMWLFRSVDLADLNPLDLRACLINHFKSPLAQSEKLAVDMRSRCETEFEKDIFDVMTNLGYRVHTQVQAGSYRIDLVIEGASDARLAIECDGDSFHGADRWDTDMRRQRTLERAGWTFWRCFASTYRIRTAECVADLVRTLEDMGIKPVAGSKDAIVNPETLVEYLRMSVEVCEPEEIEESGVEAISETQYVFG